MVAPVGFLVTLALGYGVHVFVERPLVRLRRRLAHQRPAPAAAPA